MASRDGVVNVEVGSRCGIWFLVRGTKDSAWESSATLGDGAAGNTSESGEDEEDVATYAIVVSLI